MRRDDLLKVQTGVAIWPRWLMECEALMTRRGGRAISQIISRISDGSLSINSSKRSIRLAFLPFLPVDKRPHFLSSVLIKGIVYLSQHSFLRYCFGGLDALAIVGGAPVKVREVARLDIFCDNPNSRLCPIIQVRDCACENC